MNEPGVSYRVRRGEHSVSYLLNRRNKLCIRVLYHFFLMKQTNLIKNHHFFVIQNLTPLSISRGLLVA